MKTPTKTIDPPASDAEALAYYLAPYGTQAPRTPEEKALYLRGKALHQGKGGEVSITGSVVHTTTPCTGTRTLYICCGGSRTYVVHQKHSDPVQAYVGDRVTVFGKSLGDARDSLYRRVRLISATRIEVSR